MIIFSYFHWNLISVFQFKIAEGTLAPVFYGNTISPSEAKSPPNVSFDSTIDLAGNVRIQRIIQFVIEKYLIISCIPIDFFRVVVDAYSDESGWTFKGQLQGICALVNVRFSKWFYKDQCNRTCFCRTNIPGGQDVLKGDQIVPYIQPFPAKGTGFHRHIFVLYKQNKRIDLSSLKLKDKYGNH